MRGFVAIALRILFCAPVGQLAHILGISPSTSHSWGHHWLYTWVELDIQSFVLCIGTLEFDSCTYLLSSLDLQNFTFRFK